MKVENGVLTNVLKEDLVVLKFNERSFWNGVESICAESFLNVKDRIISIKIPNGIKNLSYGNFANYQNLKKVVLPKTLTKIENSMFAYCSNLKTVAIPNELEEIGDKVFEGCSSLKTIRLPKNLQVIGEEAFAESGLKHIVIPKSVKIIKNRAFGACYLDHVQMYNGLIEIGDSAFYGCNKLKQIIVPNTVEKIGANAFKNCVNLFVAKIPNEVTEIGEGAFENCKKLLTINIPTSITKIANDTFAYCEWLADITIPSSVREIGARAFRNCYCMTQLKIPNTVKKISESSFDGCDFNFATKTKDGWELTVDKPDGDNVVVPFEFFRELCKNNELDEINNYDFRFFNNELKSFLSELEKDEDYGNLYKFAKVIGCFSKEKIRDKNKRETEAYLGQKASSFLAALINKKVMKISDFSAFDHLDVSTTPTQELYAFLSYDENSKFKNIEMLLELEQEQKETFSIVLKNFKEAEICRLDVGKDGSSINCSWKKAIKRLLQLKSSGQEVIDSIIFNRLSQEQKDELLQLQDDVKKNNVPHHILGKELKEKTILVQIEEVRNQTGNMLSKNLQTISELYEKQFTYEFLDKHDVKNAVIGLYTSCCASITRSEYGREIARATMLANDVQNLVVRDSSGRIIAKGALYVNREKGYGIFNDFEINCKYRKNETDSGRYKDDEHSENEMVREKIFETLMRGMNDFIREYDLQNPNNPIKQVNVGMEFNRLKLQCERFCKETKNLSVPVEYSFEDTFEEQRVLYAREELVKQEKKVNKKQTRGEQVK